MGNLYGLIVLEFRRIFSERDRSLFTIIKKYRNTELISFAVNPNFDGKNFATPISILQTLETNQTPMEMMHCIQSVNDSIIAAVEANLTDKNISLKNVAITTDELIPLIAYIITRVDLKYLESNMYYMENFIFTNISTTQFGFTLVNFRAAILFLRGDQLPQAPDPNIKMEDVYDNITIKRSFTQGLIRGKKKITN